ncbi:MAG TPA: hypothetical protein VFA90_01905 [Terriglobales bacterium]|nr:hypothetical protein [Terriglobales bacterium]
MRPQSAGKGTVEYIEAAASPLVFEQFQVCLSEFLKRNLLNHRFDSSQIQVLFEISGEYRRRQAAILQMREDKLVRDWKNREALMNSIEKQLTLFRKSLEKTSSKTPYANTALLAKSTARKLSQFETKLKRSFSLIKDHQYADETMYKMLSLKTLRDEYVGHLDYYVQQSTSGELTQAERDIILAGSMLAAGFFTSEQDKKGDLVSRIAMARSRAQVAIEDAFPGEDDGPVFQMKPRKNSNNDSSESLITTGSGCTQKNTRRGAGTC